MVSSKKRENRFVKNMSTSPDQIDNVHNSESEVTSSARNMTDVVNLNAADGDCSEQNDSRVSELLNDLQRTRADFENFRKQVDLQKSQAVEAAKDSTVTTLLPLLDDIDRAIAAYPEQLAPLAKNLTKTYKDLNLEKINSAEGVDFNPDFHDAVMVEDGDGEHEVIAETLRPGYLYRGSVLRPAMVKVKRV